VIGVSGCGAPAPPGPGGILGYVFDDRNESRVFDTGDERLPGEEVALEPQGEPQRSLSARTDADGRFRFDEVPAGRYRITLQVPDGFDATRDTSFLLTMRGDGMTEMVQFGITRR